MNALALGLVVSLLPAADPVKEAKPGEVLARPTESRLVKHLQADDLAAATRESNEAPLDGHFLIVAAEKAEAAGKTADALCLYEAYLRHFPLEGYVVWTQGRVSPHRSGQADEYRQAVAGYLALLAKTEKPTADWFTQSEKALKLYDDVLAAFAKRDAKTYLPLVDEIVTKYPKSLFVQPAVLCAFMGRRVLGHAGEGFANPVGLLDDYLKAMTKAGVPEGDRLLVLLVREEQVRREATKYEPTAEYVKACETARSLPVRQAFLLDRVRDRAKAKDAKGVAAAAEAYLATYPDAARTAGREKVVSAFYDLAAGGVTRPSELLELVQAWQKGKVSSDAALLQAVAGLYEKANDLTRAADMYQQAAAVGKTAAERVRAKHSLAVMYAGAKDEKKLLPLLTELADLEADAKAGTAVELSARHYAREMLGDHHYARKEWKEALAAYEAWDYQSGGCGLGAKEAKEKKAARIAECRKRLDK